MLSEHAAHTIIPILQTSEIIRKLLLFLEKNFFDVMHTLHIIHSIRAVTIILVSLTALTSCTQRQWRHAQGAAWGTSYHITYFSNRVLDDSVVAVMRNVELSLSPFEPASNISRINRGDTDIADRNVQRVFARAMEIWKCSNGCFDPTIAPLVNLWGFGTKEGDELPDWLPWLQPCYVSVWANAALMHMDASPRDTKKRLSISRPSPRAMG